MRFVQACVLISSIITTVGCGDCPNPLAPSAVGAAASPKLVALKITGPSDLPIGQTAQMRATAQYSDGSEHDVTTSALWRTNDVSVCTIDANGVLAALSTGTCEIGALFETAAAKVGDIRMTPSTGAVSGQPAKVVGVSVNGPTRLRVGQRVRLGAVARYEGGREEDVTNRATWVHENPAIAEASSDGTVTGRGPGSAAISARFEGHQGQTRVTVDPDSSGTTTLTIEGPRSVRVGETIQLSAIGQRDGARADVTGAAQWRSDSANATVDRGRVTGRSPGTARIHATIEGYAAEHLVEVAPAGTGAPGGGTPTEPYIIGLRVAADGDASQVPVGSSLRFRAMAKMSDGSEREVTQVATWGTDRPAFARVDAPGVVTVAGAAAEAMLNPNSRVYANHGGFTGDANISARSPEPSSMVIGSGGPITASAGSTLPNVGAAFRDGSSLTLPPDFPSLRWSLQPQGLLGNVGPPIPLSGSSLPATLPSGSYQLGVSLSGRDTSVPLTVR